MTLYNKMVQEHFMPQRKQNVIISIKNTSTDCRTKERLNEKKCQNVL